MICMQTSSHGMQTPDAPDADAASPVAPAVMSPASPAKDILRAAKHAMSDDEDAILALELQDLQDPLFFAVCS